MKKTMVVDLILLLIVFIWGATFVVVQNAIQMLPPNLFNSVRFFIATLFLAIIYFIRDRQALQKFTASLFLCGGILGFVLFVSYATQTVGLLYTTPSKAGFITGLSVVLVPLFAFLLLKQRIRITAVLGVGLAVVGLYLLSMSGSFALSLGDFLILICAICFAMQIVLTGKFSPRFPTLPLVIVQLFTVSLLSMVYAFLFEDWSRIVDPSIIFHSEVIWALFITAIPGTALAFLAQTAFQKETSPTHIALIYALEPVFAALTSYLWINEILTGKQMLGCALILGGMLLSELPFAAWLKNRRMLFKQDRRTNV
ncbi:DMT family transporter [Brevibacillus daliensis]|uniref:DMT family transporter n=1 Tax=Brevibacillus daliensis TaxID=2892995 RepID=UPI001E4BC934|nr:DMT family transporter [Brevibacillus daliensis]